MYLGVASNEDGQRGGCLMNIQNSGRLSGKLTIELPSCRKPIKDTCVLVKHVGKTEPAEMQFTNMTKPV